MSTQPSLDIEEVWVRRQAQLVRLDHWRLNGRLAIKYDVKGWTAGVDWQQINNNLDIQIFGPLGRKVGQIRSKSQAVELVTSKGKVVQAKDPDILLKELLGVSLPVSGMRYWVLGMPVPEQPHKLSLDGQGRLSHLVQAGWDVRYSGYDRFSHTDLPVGIIFNRGEVRLKIIIKQWDLAV